MTSPAIRAIKLFGYRESLYYYLRKINDLSGDSSVKHNYYDLKKRQCKDHESTHVILFLEIPQTSTHLKGKKQNY